MSNKIFLLLLLLIVISSVFYFSWLPDPSFKNETYLPKWLVDWGNNNYNVRTAVPFLGLGFLLEAYSQPKRINKINGNNYVSMLKNIAIAAVIVCIAEAGQFFIQKRNQDLADVFYGIIGSSTGAVVYNFLRKIRYEK
jgi:glycopeptide antibiotics resistance protein